MFITEKVLTELNYHKSIKLITCAEIEALEAFIKSDKMKKWDEEKGFFTLYKIEKIS